MSLIEFTSIRNFLLVEHSMIDETQVLELNNTREPFENQKWDLNQEGRRQIGTLR